MLPVSDRRNRRPAMERRMRMAIGAAAVAVIALAGGGIAVAASTDDDDSTDIPITGAELDRATAAALAHTGGGQVTETEVGDEESLYEVEVTLPDGSKVDVQLDEDFHVVSTKADSDQGEQED
jgi:uncharacterized membrane protein YkoI